MSGNYKSPSPLLTVKTRPLPENMEPDELSRTSITKYTKHYYIGTERISSAIGTMKNLGLLCENNWSGSQDIVEEMSDKTLVAGNVLTADYDTFEKELQLPEPFLYRTYLLCAARFHEPINYDAYWYHPDHLGSSSYITNLAGEVSQHMEYLPFGETLVEEHLNSYNSPYKFNAKEFDAETGNYYYGARYYNPKWSIWLSVDPLAEDYPSLSPYVYVANNPIKYIDPDGREIILSFASESARAAYIKTANKALGGAYEVSISKAGKVSLVATGNNVKLTPEQQAFHKAYSKAVTSEHKVQQKVVENEWQPLIGSFKSGELDIGDVQAFDEAGEGGTSSAGALIHETIEQLEKAKMGLKPGQMGEVMYDENGNKIYVDYNKAHKAATKVENDVNGNKRVEGDFLDGVFEKTNGGAKTRQTVTIPKENGEQLQVKKTKL